MKSLVQAITVVLIVVLLALPAAASSDAAANGLSTDKELLVKLSEFENFARSKVKQFNKNHNNSVSHMKITRLDDGTYRARYHKIDDATMKVKVRRSQSSTTPYVGIVTYKEHIYESSAQAPEEFQPDLFAVVEVIPNRHIFSFRKGSWN